MTDALNPEKYRVTQPITLADMDAEDTFGLTDKDEAKKITKKNRKAMEELQYTLFAEKKQALLIVLQAMDTGGKDSTIRKVFSGINPQGVQVHSFGKPSSNELDRDYLWRVHQKVPRRGNIGIFNRSHYEDVLVVRVHNLVPEKVWEKRYQHINDFERRLVDEGTRIVKIYLHISKDEQARRLQDRLDKPHKNWKFNVADLEERKHWSTYQQAFEAVLAQCSTPYAPWYTIPANNKWARNAMISTLVKQELEAMNPQFPSVTEDLSNITVQ